MSELSTAPVTAVAAAGGYLVGVTDASTPAFQRIPIDAVRDGLAKAETALQAGDVGSAAALEVAEIDAMIALALGDFETLLAAILGPQ